MWCNRCGSDTMSARTFQLVAENRAQVVNTQRLVSEGLGGILEKVAQMQASLLTTIPT